MAPPTDAAAIDAAVPCPTSLRKSFRFNRICSLGVILIHPPMTILVVENDPAIDGL